MQTVQFTSPSIWRACFQTLYGGDGSLTLNLLFISADGHTAEVPRIWFYAGPSGFHEESQAAPWD